MCCFILADLGGECQKDKDLITRGWSRLAVNRVRLPAPASSAWRPRRDGTLLAANQKDSIFNSRHSTRNQGALAGHLRSELEITKCDFKLSMPGGLHDERWASMDLLEGLLIPLSLKLERLAMAECCAGNVGERRLGSARRLGHMRCSAGLFSPIRPANARNAVAED